MSQQLPIPEPLWNTIPAEAQAALLAAWKAMEDRIAELEAIVPRFSGDDRSRRRGRADRQEAVAVVGSAVPRVASAQARDIGSAVVRTARGSRFVERMLTVVATCRQQGRNVLDYLTSCFEAVRSGQAIPSLLPAEPPKVKVA